MLCFCCHDLIIWFSVSVLHENKFLTNFKLFIYFHVSFLFLITSIHMEKNRIWINFGCPIQMLIPVFISWLDEFINANTKTCLVSGVEAQASLMVMVRLCDTKPGCAQFRVGGVVVHGNGTIIVKRSWAQSRHWLRHYKRDTFCHRTYGLSHTLVG